jgi:hypothetical protein
MTGPLYPCRQARTMAIPIQGLDIATGQQLAIMIMPDGCQNGQ